MSETLTCEICEREIPDLTKHHLIPRSCHKTKKTKSKHSREELNQCILICQPCHSNIHNVFTEKTLAESFNTLDLLKEDEDIEKFTKWIKKKHASFKSKHSKSNNKR